ncbi:hypothetical protein EYF80_062997 [Liparis tanakae]|uniref:Uncharacterized protein n=1 Tax=Liparis tanakae TaxID=230148 RepID=A0A4Z2EDN1_9TELE|nr:hypothetical protein EYF80_062997 [Liparis tanakae]
MGPPPPLASQLRGLDLCRFQGSQSVDTATVKLQALSSLLRRQAALLLREPRAAVRGADPSDTENLFTWGPGETTFSLVVWFLMEVSRGSGLH